MYQPLRKKGYLSFLGFTFGREENNLFLVNLSRKL